MLRETTIQVSLSSRQLEAVNSCIQSGDYESVSEVVRDSLKKFFDARPASSIKGESNLARAYKSTARRDRTMARAWAELDDSWPEK